MHPKGNWQCDSLTSYGVVDLDCVFISTQSQVLAVMTKAGIIDG